MMIHRTKIFLSLAVLMAFLGTACGSSEQPTMTPVPSPEPTITSQPTPTEVPTATTPPEPILTILLEDDFSDPDSGWERYNEFDGVLDYQDGAYRMWVNVPSNLFWVSMGEELGDVRIEVEAARIAGPDSNRYGVMCRYSPETFQAYMFLLSSEGRYGIGKYADREVELFGSGQMEPNEVVLQGEDSNHIRAECIGDRLSLQINGEKVLEVQDPDLQMGDVGLIAGTVGEAGTDILFDNWVVYQP